MEELKQEASILLSGVIHAHAGAGLGAMAYQSIPTCPDTSLPWSDRAGPDGWSAKMFLHQTIAVFLFGKLVDRLSDLDKPFPLFGVQHAMALLDAIPDQPEILDAHALYSRSKR